MAKFKAIIVGGSVGGLTLAHAFDSAGIDYVLLEARDTFAPPMGATIVLQASGGRILEQMGLYHRLLEEGKMVKMTNSIIRRSDGRVVGVRQWPGLLEHRLGYCPGIFSRQKFLSSMYDQLQHKQKAHVNKKVIAVEHGENAVVVRCADGSSFTGDIVVGADGIHSRVRKEMQRLAPPEIVSKDSRSVSAEYVCFYGISAVVPTLIDGDMHCTLDIGHSALLFVAEGGIPQWFFIMKMDKKYYGDEIPRFTKDDMERQLLKHGDFQLSEGVTLRRLMDERTQLSYLALEEANYNLWTSGRIVCLGDAIHKMTPNMGQGGNQAIESAVVLTNCLKELLDRKGDTTSLREIRDVLTSYHELRKERAKRIVDLSGLVTRAESLDTLKDTLRFLYLPIPSDEQMLEIQRDMCIKAPILNHLPLPPRLETLEAWDAGDEIPKAPRAQL